MTDTTDRADELLDWYREDLPEDGAALLDELRDTLTRYVAFSDEHSAIAVTMWIATTHALPAFDTAPRLVITSPEKRCGKTRLLDLIDGTCHNPLATADATVAAIFRSLGGDHPPTLLIDEADTIWGAAKKASESAEDLRKLLNAGHQRGRPALRCVGPAQTPTTFDVFAMAALAGIGALPDTVTDRAVNIRMRRRANGETVAKFRSRRDRPKLKALQERLDRWAADRISELSAAEPDMPVDDRAADTWEPLIAVADAAGGHWPQSARTACKVLVTAADASDEDSSLGVRLLSDIASVFTERDTSFVLSADLVNELRRIETSPWNDFDLTPSKLAYRLREFRVKPRRSSDARSRGYRREDFDDVFRRYIRQNPSTRQKPQVDGDFTSDGLKTDPSSRQMQPVKVSEPVRRSEPPTSGFDALTGSDGLPDGNGPTHSRATTRHDGRRLPQSAETNPQPHTQQTDDTPEGDAVPDDHDTNTTGTARGDDAADDEATPHPRTFVELPDGRIECPRCGPVIICEHWEAASREQ
ncbi:DUF3631 domain-containing protein [Mycobacterium sp. SM1]|uniref:DUF3631 domain-containing protein n=1 Tax=Mycobacterium sp. SM1 TaxID=2816243 RepID=UPI001BCC5D9F|nr:DUF3631 domain-containing protein [Mycobacterium sp. SM1]MBS4730061.1 DUF3631 domain-containing protein [Mycobacterium sp. SM1]